MEKYIAEKIQFDLNDVGKNRGERAYEIICFSSHQLTTAYPTRWTYSDCAKIESNDQDWWFYGKDQISIRV